MPLFRIAAGTICVLGSICAVSSGVEEDRLPASEQTANHPESDPDSSPLVFPTETAGQVGPETYLLPDEQGRLLPMLDWQFEDFLRYWKSREGFLEQQREPAFSLQRLECSAEVENERFVRMRADLRIRLQEEQRISVPLAFPNGILLSYEIEPSDSHAYVHFDEKARLHVLWVQGRVGESRQVHLELLLPMQVNGNQSLLKFHGPRAVTSRFRMTVPGTAVVDEPVTPDTSISTSLNGDSKHIEVHGLTNTTTIAWRSGNSASRVAESLIANSETRIHADGDVLRTSVALTVQNMNGVLDRFRVRLPPGGMLIENQMDGVTFHAQDGSDSVDTTVENGSGEDAGLTGAVYEVRLNRPQEAALALEIQIERPLDVDEDGVSIELEGIDVLEALRQSGSLQLRVSDDLRVRWKAGHRIEQIVTKNVAADPADLAATFEYDTAQWRLPIMFAKRPTEILADPEYVLEVGREDLRLTVNYRFSVRGTKLSELAFSLGPWELAGEIMSPDETISRDNVFPDASGEMYIQLRNPLEGVAEFSLPLRLPRVATSGRLQVPLPTYLAGRLQEGRLRVFSDPTLEVIAQTDAIEGLMPTAAPSSAAMPLEPFDATVQHFRVTSHPAEFVATVKQRTRTILNETQLFAELYADHIAVKETIRLEIRHLALNDLLLRLPRALATNASLTFDLDGQSIAPSWEEVSTDPGAEGQVLARHVLEQPRLGELFLHVRFQIPFRSSELDESESVREVIVPLVVPAADSHHIVASIANQTNDLQLQFTRQASATYPESGESFISVNPGERSQTDFAASLERMTVVLRQAPRAYQRTTLVDRMWVQTWIVGEQMRTRTAMRVTPSSNDMTLQIDNDTGALVEIRVDNQPVSTESLSDTAIALEVTAPGAEVPRVIEVIQQGRFTVDAAGKLQVTPPRLADAKACKWLFWQLILPASWHGFEFPEKLVSESPWKFTGTYWSRVPAWSQAELEDYIGVPHARLPAEDTNQLVVSGIELPGVLEVKLVRRSTIVLLTSGVVLGMGLAIVYIRLLQRLELLIVLVLSVAVAGILYPQLAPFLGQAGLLGLALLLVAIVLKGVVGRWQTATAPRAPAETNIVRTDTSSTGPWAASLSAPDAASSVRTAIPSLTESSAQHPA